MSQSDLSRLTTMLLRVGCPFVRSYSVGGIRCIEVGSAVFEFSKEGELDHVSFTPSPSVASPCPTTQSG